MSTCVPQCRHGTIGRAAATCWGCVGFGGFDLMASLREDSRPRFQSQMPNMIANRTIKIFMICWG
jgi:hypothetical protein